MPKSFAIGMSTSSVSAGNVLVFKPVFIIAAASFLILTAQHISEHIGFFLCKFHQGAGGTLTVNAALFISAEWHCGSTIVATAIDNHTARLDLPSKSNCFCHIAGEYRAV